MAPDWMFLAEKPDPDLRAGEMKHAEFQRDKRLSEIGGLPRYSVTASLDRRNRKYVRFGRWELRVRAPRRDPSIHLLLRDENPLIRLCYGFVNRHEFGVLLEICIDSQTRSFCFHHSIPAHAASDIGEQSTSSRTMLGMKAVLDRPSADCGLTRSGN